VYEHIAPLQEPLQSAVYLVELLRTDRPVVFAPPDVVLGARLADNEFVLSCPGGVLTGGHGHRALMGEPTLTAEEDLFIECLRE
jgi:hypothetical protein